jgi:hypothetical protein
MNNKILGIIATSVATISGAVISAPAQAQTSEPAGLANSVDVQIYVSPTLYLRTFKTVNLTITGKDLGATDRDATGETTGDTPIPVTRPTGFGGTAGGDRSAIKKNVKELFAVFGANGTQVTVTAKVDSAASTLTNSADNTTAEMTAITLTNATGTISANRPLVGGADLTFDLTDATAGTYTGGKVIIEAKGTL